MPSLLPTPSLYSFIFCKGKSFRLQINSASPEILDARGIIYSISLEEATTRDFLGYECCSFTAVLSAKDISAVSVTSLQESVELLFMNDLLILWFQDNARDVRRRTCCPKSYMFFDVERNRPVHVIYVVFYHTGYDSQVQCRRHLVISKAIRSTSRTR